MPPRMLTYRWFAKVYGFPPDVVDALPEDAYDWFPRIEQAEARAVEMKRKQEERAARRSQRG